MELTRQDMSDSTNVAPDQEQHDKSYTAREGRQGAEANLSTSRAAPSPTQHSPTVPEQGRAATVPDKEKQWVRSGSPIRSSRRQGQSQDLEQICLQHNSGTQP